jgi:uncharacterized protein (DUF2141 family)
MKTITPLALTLALAAPLALAQTPPTAPPADPASGCATVEVHNVRPQQGQLMLAAYGSAESFGKQAVKALRLPAGEATMRVQLCGLGGSEVALMLFQDLDSDGKMGRNLVGMPTEPWGSSGKPGMFGPQWDSGKVPLDGTAITVKMSI